MQAQLTRCGLARDAAGALILRGNGAAIDAAEDYRVYAQTIFGQAIAGERSEIALGVELTFHRETAYNAADIVVAVDAAVIVAVGGLAVGVAVVLHIGRVIHQNIAGSIRVEEAVDGLDRSAVEGAEVAVDHIHIGEQNGGVAVYILPNGGNFVCHVVHTVGDDTLQVVGGVGIGNVQGGHCVGHR